jgi:hypothetical protein
MGGPGLVSGWGSGLPRESTTGSLDGRERLSIGGRGDSHFGDADMIHRDDNNKMLSKH